MADEPVKAGSQTGIIGKLLEAADKDDERKEREHERAVAALERQAVLWQRTALALIVVLLVLVSGLVGVGVTGNVPGLGEIHIEGADAPAEVAP